MLATLLRQELLRHLLTFRLAVALAFTVVLTALTTFIGSLDYRHNLAAYEREARAVRAELDQATVYAQVFPRIVVPPQPLSILCRGIVGTAGRTMVVEVDRIQIASWPLTESYDNQLVKSLAQIDFSTAVALLLSFLAVILGFDGVSGEREAGTLAQVLANPVPRSQVYLAKLLGGSLALWLPFAGAFALSLLIARTVAPVAFTGDDWLRLGLFFALSCLFLSQVHAASLLVSTLTRSSGTALVVCLFAWLVGGVGFMSALPSAARYAVAERPYQELEAQEQELDESLQRDLEAWEADSPGPGEAYLRGIERDHRLRFAHPRGYAWLQRRHAFELERRLALADQRYQLRWANQQPLARQAHAVDDWSVASPITNYQVLSYRLARTSLDDSFFMARAGRDYRRTYLDFLRGRGAFADRRWFTDDPPDQEPLIPDPESATPQMLAGGSPFMARRLAWAQEQERLAAADPARRLDLADLPAFGTRWQQAAGATLASMVPGILVLVLTWAVAALAGLRRFLTLDPR
ncbi:MAG: ABC transporter permease [Gemmatimonadota bacterium]